MNLTTLTLAARGLNGAWNYFREMDDTAKRNTYEALVEAIKNDDIDSLHDLASIDELEGMYDAARKQAGEVTRASHDRLDRRRAAFAAAAPDKKARRIASKDVSNSASNSASPNDKDASGNGFGTVAGVLIGLGALVAGGWALWEFYLRDKIAEDTKEHPAPLAEDRDETPEPLSTLDLLDDDQRKATDA